MPLAATSLPLSRAAWITAALLLAGVDAQRGRQAALAGD